MSESNNVYDKAAENGWDLVKPNPHEIFVDIDNDDQLKIFNEHFKLLKSKDIDIVIDKQTISPGGGKHFYIKLVGRTEPLTNLERLMFQAVLGSDIKRETLGFISVWNCIGHEVPSCFFEKPEVKD